MKNKKSISLFFSCILVSLSIGLTVGLCIDGLFGNNKEMQFPEMASVPPSNNKSESVVIHEEKTLPVTNQEDKITADTSYMILEKDLNTGAITTRSMSMPAKYIGLTRQGFQEQLLDYVANPPLTELENGFVNAELVSFSPLQVEVQMNYRIEKPTGIYYIMTYDNKIVVMLEDKKTVYLSTEISLKTLPEDVQQDIIRGLFIPNDKSLYDFLENYTS